MMTVYYKRNQVSLLRALGMKRSDILQLFLTHGLIISGIGVFLGFALGLSACFLIQNSELLKLPQGVYLIKKLPVRFLDMEYAIIGIGAFLLSLAASIYPAFKAAQQDPGVGLRYS
jgi:lipoprotein-releasing system permease protein